jgi:hypothetical protein
VGAHGAGVGDRSGPSKGEWTMFDLPVRGTEIRHVSLLERDGVTA